MSATKTLIWAALLLVLAAFYYIYELEGTKKRQEATRQQELLLRFAVDDVTELTIQRPTETITAVKREGHWQLTVPVSAPGDAQKYNALVRSLAELRYQRLVEERPDTLEPFGLTTPSVELYVHVSAQTSPHVLRLGDKSPTGNGYYVQMAGHPQVYLVSTTVKDIVDASLYDLRDKTVLAFDPAEVHEVHLEFATLPPVVLQRQDSNAWQLTAPVSAKADAQQVQTLLQRLRDVKIKAFVAEQPADLDPYGVHPPALRLTIVAGTDRVVKTLLLGNQDAERQGVYAKRHDTANVFLLPQAFWDSLPKTPAALRDKTLLHFDRERITRLEIVSADNRLVITRTGPRQYQLEQPVSADGDNEAIYRLLQELHDLRAIDFSAETPDDLAAYGLASPRFQVTLWEETGNTAGEVRQHTLHFGSAAADGQGLYARVPERPTIYLVDSQAALRLMEKTAFELRNKKILAFESAAIQKIRIQYPTSALTLERHGDSWKLSEPKSHTLRERWKVDDLLYELRTLEYAAVIAESADNGTRYGLDTPQVQITLWRQDGTAVGPLAIGQTTETSGSDTQLVFAHTGPHSPLYAIKAAFLDIVPKTVADLTSE